MKIDNSNEAKNIKKGKLSGRTPKVFTTPLLMSLFESLSKVLMAKQIVNDGRTDDRKNGRKEVLDLREAAKKRLFS